jgi:UDP-N-acetylglucosamine 4,6-dehydratase
MKSVLITGGSGSFGNAFIAKLLETNPDRVVVYSRDEQKQEVMARTFSDHHNAACLRFFIGDVRDCDRLSFAMHGITTVVHAAALKIVPTAEYNPTECIATNVTGAENVIKAAIRSGVKKVVALSTDKAVNPVNLYGASKLAAEKIFIAANALSAGSTAFSVVRYGNVAGSRGSVVPLFKKLAAEGKPLPITDVRMTRFWITLDQSVDLVFYCHNNMNGREIFVPKIPSIKITDLAEAIAGSRFWVETGIRPGEKIHEVLVTEDESRNALSIPNVYVLYPTIKPGDITPVPHAAIGSGTLDFLPEGFRYTSDTNTEWLDVAHLRGMLK